MDSLIPQAMAWKFGAKCSKDASGDGIDSWEHPTEPKPNKKQIQLIVEEYQEFLKENSYKELRAKEYPSIEDQLDALWKGGKDEEDMRARIEQIKEKYPKL